jgi:hypothetical protein
VFIVHILCIAFYHLGSHVLIFVVFNPISVPFSQFHVHLAILPRFFPSLLFILLSVVI